MLELIRQFRWQDLIDIGIITFLIYRSLQIVRGSRAMQMIMGLAVILVAYVSSRALGLFTLNWILDNFLGSIILVIIVIFQSDIRRALTQVGSAPLFVTAERMIQRREDIIEEIAQAAMSLAAKHVGALIVLQREVGLNEYMEIGTRLDARARVDVVSRVLKGTIVSDFDPHKTEHILTEGGRHWLQQYSWPQPPMVAGDVSLVLPAWTNRHPDWRGEIQPSLAMEGDLTLNQGGAFRGINFIAARCHFTYTNMV